MKTEYGINLEPKVREEALRRFGNRYTKDHTPGWAIGTESPVQFESDREWLEHTEFYIRRDGKLSNRHNYCISTPTWPDNPELRK